MAARTIVFPSRNNVTYRSGFIKMTAFGSEFDQAAIEGNTNDIVDNKLKNTARVVSPDFDGEGLEYLENAIQNMYTERSKMSGQPKFIAILPLPLGVKDTIGVDWNSTPSAFIEGAYGRIKSSGIGEASTYATAGTLVNAGGGYLNDNWKQAGTNLITAGQENQWISLGSGMNSGVEMINNGHAALSHAVATHPANTAVLKPGHGTRQILGMKSDKSLMDFHNEAAALNGTRQIIFDPGYWQSFAGVQPRKFTLSWDIIPENHEDAINGLEMCARLREFSLPQSVSGVELLSPCYWQIDWSNKYLDSQTLYSNLVIESVEVDYAQQGEWHGASTPKMFRISIQFAEAKAPTADIYKFGDNFIEVSTAARGASRGGAGGGGGRGAGGNRGGTGTGGTGGSGGPVGGGGSIPFPNPGGGGSFPDIPGIPPGTNNGGKIWEIIKENGGILGGILSQIGNVLGGIIDGITTKGGDILGDKLEEILGGFGGDLGKILGDWVDDAVEDAAERAGKVLKDAIKNRDFKDLDEKLREAVLSGEGLSDKVGEAIGGAIGKKIEDMVGVDIPDDVFRDILEDIKDGKLDGFEGMEAIEDQIKQKVGEYVYGVLGNMKLPDIVDIINKPSIILKPQD